MPLFPGCSLEVPNTLTVYTTCDEVPQFDQLKFAINYDGETWSGSSQNGKVEVKLLGNTTLSYMQWKLIPCDEGDLAPGNFFCDPLFGEWFGWVTAECAGTPPPFIHPLTFRFNDRRVLAAGIPRPSVPCRPPPPGTCRIKPCPPSFSTKPVNYATGELFLAASDISAGGFGVPWGHTRNFSSRLSVSQTLGHGFNWQVAQWRYLVIHGNGDVAVLGATEGPLFFKRSGATYVPEFGVLERLTVNGGTGRFVLTNPHGEVTEFDGEVGSFRKFTAPGGNFIEVTGVSENLFNFTEVQRTYSQNGVFVTERFTYEYGTETGNLLLSQVTLSRKAGAGAWVNSQRASYTYYDTGEPFGAQSDLKTVVTENWVDNGWQETGTSYYRYYKPSDSSSSSSSSSGGILSPIPQHPLKFVLNPASYDRMLADAIDPLTASDGELAAYADYFYAYDSDWRVTEEFVESGSAGISFSRITSDFPELPDYWKTKTIETRPDDTQIIVYANSASQPILKILKSGELEWFEFWKYDDNFDVVLHAHSSAISGYDDAYPDLLHEVDGHYEFLKDYDGLIDLYEHHTPSRFLSAEKIRHGQLGDCFILREYEYTPCCFCPGSSSSSSSSSSGCCDDNFLWFLSKLIEYPEDGLSLPTAPVPRLRRPPAVPAPASASTPALGRSSPSTPTPSIPARAPSSRSSRRCRPSPSSKTAPASPPRAANGSTSTATTPGSWTRGGFCSAIRSTSPQGQ